MAKDDENNIRKPDPDKGEAVHAVASVTETVPHAADADSSPGPYEGLDINRPPVSTNDPRTPIAQSLVAGAGAPSPEFTAPESVPADVPVTKDDKTQAVTVNEPAAPSTGRGAKG